MILHERGELLEERTLLRDERRDRRRIARGDRRARGTGRSRAALGIADDARRVRTRPLHDLVRLARRGGGVGGTDRSETGIAALSEALRLFEGRGEVLRQAIEELVDLTLVVALEGTAELHLLDVQRRQSPVGWGGRGARGPLAGAGGSRRSAGRLGRGGLEGLRVLGLLLPHVALPLANDAPA